MDNHTKEQRHKNMQAIKNKDSDIELILRKELWSRGIRYRKNTNKVYGHPDLAIIGKKIAIFCDSEFWHGFDWDNRVQDIKTNRQFWIPKIEKNIARDKEVTERLNSEGWTVIRFWGNDIKKHKCECADLIEKVVKSNGKV